MKGDTYLRAREGLKALLNKFRESNDTAFRQGKREGMLQAVVAVRTLAAKLQVHSYAIEESVPSGFSCSYCRGYRDGLERLAALLPQGVDDPTATTVISELRPVPWRTSISGLVINPVQSESTDGIEKLEH